MAAARRAAEAGDEHAALALTMYVHRLYQSIAAMTASLGGVDVLVFTGGVGEHDALLRDEVVGRLAFLHEFDVVVVEAREDLETAGLTRAAL